MKAILLVNTSIAGVPYEAKEEVDVPLAVLNKLRRLGAVAAEVAPVEEEVVPKAASVEKKPILRISRKAR